MAPLRTIYRNGKKRDSGYWSNHQANQKLIEAADTDLRVLDECSVPYFRKFLSEECIEVVTDFSVVKYHWD